MKTSNLAIAKIKSFEGCRLAAYQDSVGVWTIGYGSTLNVRRGMRISQAEAGRRFLFDLETAEIGLRKLNLNLTQGQFDALADFVFNLGVGKLTNSTLLKKIRDKAPTDEIQKEFRRWVYAGGKPANGLVKRREWEARRWAE